MVGEGGKNWEMVDGGGIRGYVSVSAANLNEAGLACRHKLSCVKCYAVHYHVARHIRLTRSYSA